MHGVTANRQPSPPGKTAPPEGYESWNDYMADVELVESFWIDEQAQRGLRAMRLAPTLEVSRALLAGQQVPASALDQAWAKRLGS